MAKEQKNPGVPLLMPNSTQMPNVFLDKFLPVVSPAIWKIMSSIARQTYGWQKDWEFLSISFLEARTGLSNRTVIDGISALISAGVVLQGDQSEKGISYSLNKHCDIKKALEFLKQKERPKREKPSGGRRPPHELSSLPMNSVHGHELSSLPPHELSSREPMNSVHFQPMNSVHTHKQIRTKQIETKQPQSTTGGFAFKTALDGIRLSHAEQRPLQRREAQAALMDTSGFNPFEVARAVCLELGLSGDANMELISAAITTYTAKHDTTNEQAGEQMIALWNEYRDTVQGKYKVEWRKFFADGFHIAPEKWRKKSVAEKKPGAAQDATDMVAERRKLLATVRGANV